jgi:hypothetical protein
LVAHRHADGDDRHRPGFSQRKDVKTQRTTL